MSEKTRPTTTTTTTDDDNDVGDNGGYTTTTGKRSPGSDGGQGPYRREEARTADERRGGGRRGGGAGGNSMLKKRMRGKKEGEKEALSIYPFQPAGHGGSTHAHGAPRNQEILQCWAKAAVVLKDFSPSIFAQMPNLWAAWACGNPNRMRTTTRLLSCSRLCWACWACWAFEQQTIVLRKKKSLPPSLHSSVWIPRRSLPPSLSFHLISTSPCLPVCLSFPRSLWSLSPVVVVIFLGTCTRNK